VSEIHDWEGAAEATRGQQRETVRVVLLVSWLCFACSEPPSAPPLIESCHVTPSALDFGEVEANTRVSRTIRVVNHTGVDRELAVVPVVAPFSSDSLPGRFRLFAGATRDLTLSFAPSDGRLHLDELQLVDLGAGDCTLKVPLRGLGSGLLALQTPELDFGFLRPGSMKSLALVVSNSSRAPITLGAVNVLFDSESTGLAPLTVRPPASTVVPEHGTLALELFATPQRSGRVFGRVLLTSGEATLAAPFVLTVGAPVADAFPSSIAPWLVGFDPDTQPHGFSDRPLYFRNVGAAGPSPDADLRLTSLHVEALGDAVAEELLLNVPANASAGLQSFEVSELRLHLEPRSVGPKEFLITLGTNSPREPFLTIPVRATAAVLPACELSVSPADELRLSPLPEGLSGGTVLFKNTGTTPCVLDDLRLEGEVNFIIERGQVLQVQIPPGGQHAVTIVGPRKSSVMRVGSLSFHVFNPNSRTELIDVYSTP
jgi:hypothetical protein